jgi:hypothetical protein
MADRDHRDGRWTLRRPGGDLVCERCELADTVPTRMRGLLGRDGIDRGDGLLIKPTNSVHMFFMRFPIDVVFLDRELVVRKIVEALAPWRLAGCRGAKAALELPAGEAARRGVTLGERLVLEPVDG